MIPLQNVDPLLSSRRRVPSSTVVRLAECPTFLLLLKLVARFVTAGQRYPHGQRSVWRGVWGPTRPPRPTVPAPGVSVLVVAGERVGHPLVECQEQRRSTASVEGAVEGMFNGLVP